MKEERIKKLVVKNVLVRALHFFSDKEICFWSKPGNADWAAIRIVTNWHGRVKSVFVNNIKYF